MDTAQNLSSYGCLVTGTPRLQQAEAVLTDLRLLDDLRVFTPMLIGTIPIGVDIPSSDLDIACYAPDLVHFAQTVRQLYVIFPNFSLHGKSIRGVDSVIVNFQHGGFEIQLFAQPQPVENQYGYRHMLIEARRTRARRGCRADGYPRAEGCRIQN